MPWLESLQAATTPRFPRRFGVLFMGTGINEEHWSASGNGAEMKLSKTLAVLESAVANEDQVRSVELLNHIVPEYTPVGSMIAPASADFQSQGKAARKPPSSPKPVA